MKANPNIDELLNSFLDGELPVRQQTEVQRLVARDPEVSQRLRQLQNCKTLISALPRAQAPAEMIEQIRLRVERKTLLEEPSASGVRSAGARRLMARRLLAAAAMIALVGLLAAVVYQIVAPIPGGSMSRPVADLGGPSGVGGVPAATLAVADAGLAGRLEIRTATVAQADAILKRAFEESGSSGLVRSESVADAHSYRLVGSRQAVNRLVASLGDAWRSFDAVTLSVEGPGHAASPVTVETLTPAQVIDIVAQGTTQASLEVARSYAAANAMTANMPGREVLASLGHGSDADLTPALPNVWLTRRETAATTPATPQGEPNVTLTIVLLRTR
jgi:hypothetical protein